jgi:hypothetical protein
MTVDDLENGLYEIVRSFFVKTESVLNVASQMNILQKIVQQIIANFTNISNETDEKAEWWKRHLMGFL